MSTAAVEQLTTGGALGASDFDPRTIPLLDQAEIFAIDEGGIVSCYVPSSLIDHEEVPVKDEWAESLAKEMREIAEEDGGTGQLAPLVLGYIEGEDKLKIIDGFHRDAALQQNQDLATKLINGEQAVLARVKVTTWDKLYDVRIFTAKDHAHVRFSRVVQWIGESWQFSGLSDQLSVQQAVLLYRFDTPGTKLGIDPEVAQKAKDWVARKEGLWDMKAMTIHSHLKVAETVDPQLVHTTREKKDSHVLEAPTQAILKIFSDRLPNNFEFQNLVMDVAKQRNLKGPEVSSLCYAIADCETIEGAQEIISEIDWDNLQPAYGPTASKSLRRAHDTRHRGAAVLNTLMREIDLATGRATQSIDRDDEVTPAMLVRVEEARSRVEEAMEKLGGLATALTTLVEAGEAQAQAAIDSQAVEDAAEPAPQVQAKAVTTPSEAAPTRPKIGDTKKAPPSTPRTVTTRSQAARHMSTEREPRPSRGATESPFNKQMADYLNGLTDDMPLFQHRAQASHAEQMVITGNFSGDPERREEVRDEIRIFRQSQQKS